MNTFILLTIFYILANASFAKLIFVSIQQGQWLDLIFGWQKKLYNIGNKGGFLNNYIYKVFGGCSICFSRIFAFWGYILYYLIIGQIWGYWLPEMYGWVSIGVNIVWFFAVASITNVLAVLFINKL